MADITTNSLKTFTAYSLKQSVSRISPEPVNMFVFFGKSSNWTAEPTPDTPTGSISEQQTLRNNIKAIKKIPTANIALIVPRYNWVSNTVYARYDITDATLSTKNFYVMTSDYNVYKCINNNTNGVSTIQPYGTSTSVIQTGDGYSWKFMFNLSTFMVDNFLTPEWLPVPTDEQKTNLQTVVENAASYATGTPPGGHGKNAYLELFASRLMVVQSFNGSESSVISVSTSFRQIGIITNPLLLSTGAAATGSVYSVNGGSDNINSTSGEILYYENREVISRSSSQSETFKLVLSV